MKKDFQENVKVTKLGKKVFLVENFLSSDECKSMIQFSEEKGLKRVPYKTSFRTNSRLVVEDSLLALQLWKRVRTLVDSTVYVPITKETWHAKGLNPRFRVCKYTKDEFFGKHYDEQVILDDKKSFKKSFFTMMIYLNNAPQDGVTRFYSSSLADSSLADSVLFDVVPKQGSLLLFWQKGALHEGMPFKMDEGVKYILRTEVMYQLSSKKKTC